jgi:hypothetical protein
MIPESAERRVVELAAYRLQQPRHKGIGYRVRWIITALLLRVIAPLLWLT